MERSNTDYSSDENQNSLAVKYQRTLFRSIITPHILILTQPDSFNKPHMILPVHTMIIL